jgi:predicted negative regulator of RcsB-dependent stress response
MKLSRQRGAFKTLQDQMREIKQLVKEREDIDAKMASLDLARKKTDDHKIATGQELSYSEKLDSVADRISDLEQMLYGNSFIKNFVRIVSK